MSFCILAHSIMHHISVIHLLSHLRHRPAMVTIESIHSLLFAACPNSMIVYCYRLCVYDYAKQHSQVWPILFERVTSSSHNRLLFFSELNIAKFCCRVVTRCRYLSSILCCSTDHRTRVHSSTQMRFCFCLQTKLYIFSF